MFYISLLMKIHQLAKQLSQSHDRQIIWTIQSLLFLMKKFGKSLNSTEVLKVLENYCPDVVLLYKILWSSRCSINQCQQLLVSVSHLLDYNHLDILSSSSFDFDLLSDDIIDTIETSIIGLSVVGKGKIYKRTLNGDLQKLIITE